MTTASTPSAAAIHELFVLILPRGLPVQREGREIRYRTVRLREVSLADERAAVRLAERLVIWQGQPKLLVSDADFKLALNMRHIEAFECDGMKITQSEFDLDTIGKLTTRDWGLIEQRVFMIELAARLRAGEISQAAYDAILNNEEPATEAPQPVGPAADAGDATAPPVPGPAMLTDFAGNAATVSPASLG